MDELRKQLRDFAAQRDWDQFHDPKNLVMALTGEVGELAEIFQWMKSDVPLTDEELGRCKEEIADVLLYLIRLADKLGIDPVEAARNKLLVNEKKYPVHLAKGNSKKYDQFN